MSRSKKIVAAAAVAALTPLISSPAHGADIRWDGGGVDNNLNTAANWVGDVNPGTADFARFDAVGASKLTPSTNGGAVQYLSIFFGNTATLAETTAYTIGGTNAITLGSTTAGNYLNNDSEILQTINAPVNMIGGTVNSTNAGLSFGGVFNIGNNGTVAGNSVTFGGANPITLAAGVTGDASTTTSAALTKVGTGTLTVMGASGGWTGNVFINGGAVRINNAGAFGTSNRIETALTSGGTGLGALELDGTAGNIALTKQVTTRGRQAATINEVSIRNIAGTNTISNVLTGSGGSNFNYESAGGTLIISNWNASATTGARNLRLLGASNGEISAQTYSATATTVGLVKDGIGTWTLRNSVAGTGSYSTVTVNGGTLVLDNAFGARVTGNTTINNGGTLQVVSDGANNGEVGNGTPATILNVKAGGTLNANTFTSYSLQVGQTLIGGGSISTGGNFNVFNDNQVYIGDVATASAGTLSVTGNLALFGPAVGSGPGLHFDLSSASTTTGSDKISVAGDVSVGGGPVNVYIGTLGGGFASGTYNLISYTGATILNPSDFTLNVSGVGTTRQTFGISTAANAVNLDVTGSPASLVWKGNASNDWDIVTTSNWLNGIASDKFYQFDNVTFDDTASTTNVNLTGTLLTPTAIVVNTAGTYTFGGSGTLSGASSLTKSGIGTLLVSNAATNTLTGALTINAGTLQIGNGGANEGTITAGSIVNNGTLITNRSDSVSLAAISGTGSLIKRGGGDLILNSANSYSGATTIEAGRVFPSGGTSFGDATNGTTVSSGAMIYFVGPSSTYAEAVSFSGDGVTAQGVLRSGGSVSNTLSAPLTMTDNATINNDGGSTLVFANTLTGGTATLTKTGSGTLVLGGTGNSWSGGTIINGGNLAISDDAQLSTAPVTINSGTLELLANSSTTASRSFALGGAASTSTFQVDAASTLTLNGALNGTAGFRKLGAGTLIIGADNPGLSGTVQLGNTGANQADAGILRLTTSNGLGATTAITMPGSNNSPVGIELTNNITVSNNITTSSRETTGGGPAIPMLRNVAGNNTYNGAITVNATGGSVGFESQAGTLTIAGSVVNSVSERALWLSGAGDGAVNTDLSSGSSFRISKVGSGTWTLGSAATSYTGSTTVSGGTLRVDGSLRRSTSLTVADGAKAALTPRSSGGKKTLQVGTLSIAATGSLDLADNDLVVDAGTGMYTQIRAWVIQGLGPATTGIDSSTSTGSTRLALFDNSLQGLTSWNGGTIGAAAIVGKYTYFGDVNIDGQVTGDDYTVVDSNLNTTPAVGLEWIKGDANTDGVVTGDDYTIIDANLGSGVGNPLSASSLGGGLTPSSLAVVPEPASLGMLATGAGLLLARRRRK